jgi:GntR family transcriptional regulator
MTIRNALDILTEEGYLFRKKKVGTFVLNHVHSHNSTVIAERELSGLTRSAKNVSSKVLKFEVNFVDENVASHLNMERNTPVLYIYRLRYVNNEPVILEHTYLNPMIIPGVTIDVAEHSVYRYIEETLHLCIASAKKVTRAQPSDDDDHKYLHLKDNEPVLEIEQVAYLDDGTPFEYSLARHHYDKFEMTMYSLRRREMTHK